MGCTNRARRAGTAGQGRALAAPARSAARTQQPLTNPAANFTRYGTTPRKPPRRGGGRGSAFRRVVAVKGRLPPAHVAASAPQRGLQQPTSKPVANLTRYETTPRKPPRRGGGRGSAFRRVVAVKGRLPPAHVAASAPQWGLQQPTSK